MKTLSAIFLLAFGVGAALARLGETTQEIRARYGQPMSHDSFLGLPAESYNFNGYNLLVVFKDGRSYLEALKPLNDTDRLAPDQTEPLAGRIANCGKWSRSDTLNPPGSEFRGTNGAVAILRRGAAQPDSLVVYSSEAARTMRGFSWKGSEAKTNAPAQPAPAVADHATNDLMYLQQQAINGTPSAQRSLGQRYATGDGVPKDEQLARFWLEKAAAKGDAEAKAALKKMKENAPRDKSLSEEVIKNAHGDKHQSGQDLVVGQPRPAGTS